MFGQFQKKGGENICFQIRQEFSDLVDIAISHIFLYIFLGVLVSFFQVRLSNECSKGFEIGPCREVP